MKTWNDLNDHQKKIYREYIWYTAEPGSIILYAACGEYPIPKGKRWHDLATEEVKQRALEVALKNESVWTPVI